MLRRLHRRHEVHYVAFDNPDQPEGVARSSEYCTRAYPIAHSAAPRGSAAFYLQLAVNLFSPVPAVIGRLKSAEMRKVLERLVAQERFDSVVCDFLTPAINVPDLSRAVLFQHNVETHIWQRRAEHARGPLQSAYMRLQANRMLAYEKRVCRQAARVVAVSASDAEAMEKLFGLEAVPHVPTGVDVAAFAAPADRPAAEWDLVFIGSMDWTPNEEAVVRFVREILPLVRQSKPDCSLAVVGRRPPRSILRLAEQDARITVTGTIPDVRPYLWRSRLSIVPLRIGGGTRLKIYESMAAGVPVVSTTVGAEGLGVHHLEDIRIADSAEDFAAHCVELLGDGAERERIAGAGFRLVSRYFDWDRVVEEFEKLLV